MIRLGRQKTRCPECLAPIWLRDDIERWYPVTCPECHTALHVISVRPVVLDYLPDLSEDDAETEADEDEA